MTPRHEVKTVRAQALGLHKKLIDAARERYEKNHGQVNPGEMLRIVAFDPDFAWLRPLTGVILSIDDTLDQAEVTEADAIAVRAKVEHAFSGGPEHTAPIARA